MITRLATSPQFPCSLPSSSPSSQFPLPSSLGGLHYGVSCHTSRAGSGFGRGACTCANCLTLRSALKCHRQAYTARKVQVLCFVFIVSVPIFTWPNTKKHCCTGACSNPKVQSIFCSASLVAHMLRQILLHPCRAGIISWLLFNRLWNHQVSFTVWVHGQISLPLFGC